MIRKVMLAAAALSLVAFVSAATVLAQPWDKKTVITFSQPVEVPGHVLPAGTYTFKLADSMTDRHVVQIFNADASEIIATVMAIPDYRLTPTDKTVITFRETPVGTPEVIRAWFYPGNSVGNEFVYSRARAGELAKATQTVVPAIAVDMTDAETMKTASIVAITPDQQEMPVALAVQTMAPAPAALASGTTMTARATLPQTASLVPMIALVGFASICAALTLLVYSQRTKPVVVRIRS